MEDSWNLEKNLKILALVSEKGIPVPYWRIAHKL